MKEKEPRRPRQVIIDVGKLLEKQFGKTPINLGESDEERSRYIQYLKARGEWFEVPESRIVPESDPFAGQKINCFICHRRIKKGQIYVAIGNMTVHKACSKLAEDNGLLGLR